MSRCSRTVLAAVTALSASVAVAGPSPAAGQPTGDAATTATPTASQTARTHERPAFYDARTTGTRVAPESPSTRVARETVTTAQQLRRSSGVDLQVQVDPATGTPASVSSLDGYLTAASSRDADAVVRGYLRSNTAALGLRSADLSTFSLRDRYTDTSGITHLSYEQVSRGVPVFGNGLRAHVDDRGRLIAVQGSPISGLDALTSGASTDPRLSAAEARAGAATDVSGEADAAAQQQSASSGRSARWSNGDQAELVWFVTPQGASLGWSTYTQAGDTLDYSHVIDAASGRTLYRNDLVDFAEGDAKVYDYYPGARRGGKARVVSLTKRGWITRQARWLRGPNVSAWADVDDDNRPGKHERTPVPGTRKGAQFKLHPFDGNRLCSEEFVCTWDSDKAFSWRRNKNADVTNAFYLANKFHDWLARPGIGFNSADGNFERSDGDPVLLNALDGANTTGDGFPDGDHIDNANMSTPPNGTAPTMQMYLWHQPGLGPNQDPFLPVSGAFDASILYHEYTHGLSNRLVVDASGNSTLNSIQAGSMGEAWSDFYAMDFLVAQGFQKDDPRKAGGVRMAKYTLGDRLTFRTQALDCRPRSKAKSCTGIDGKRGGYTYGDFPTIGGGPEVHSSGEVWAQTLWDIRTELGAKTARRIITQGMRLSANDPSMLDMRNAIITADRVIYEGGNHTGRLWRIFARRGMGWYAGSAGAGDAYPAQDFKVRPRAELPPGEIAGTVVDSDTGEPARGVKVVVTGHADTYSAVTDAGGNYRIPNVAPGHYRKVTAGANGYEGITTDVRVRPNRTAKLDATLRRDWAAASGGAEVVDFNGPDYTPFGCGPIGAIDLSQGSGWGSTTGKDDGTPTATPVPKHVDIALPRAVDIVAGGEDGATAFRVDPTAVCGDPLSASTNEYRIEVSVDGETWTQVAEGSFGTVPEGEPGPDAPVTNGRYFDVPSDTAVEGVTHLRFWMDSPQVPNIETNCPDGAFGGCAFMDMTEVQLFGTPAE
jgi:extracellular elastinolytic metalloproteinase